VGRWGAYYPAKYSKWKASFSSVLRRVVEEEGIEKFTGPIEVRIVVSATRPKTSKLSHPRPDVDNYAKSVLDASNKILWDDDSQITHLFISKLWTPTKCPPQIIIYVTPAKPPLSDTKPARPVSRKTT
jgi:Holliday junction resolvase RusA-like endonuclease